MYRNNVRGNLVSLKKANDHFVGRYVLAQLNELKSLSDDVEQAIINEKPVVDSVSGEGASIEDILKYSAKINVQLEKLEHRLKTYEEIFGKDRVPTYEIVCNYFNEQLFCIDNNEDLDRAVVKLANNYIEEKSGKTTLIKSDQTINDHKNVSPPQVKTISKNKKTVTFEESRQPTIVSSGINPLASPEQAKSPPKKSTNEKKGAISSSSTLNSGANPFVPSFMIGVHSETEKLIKPTTILPTMKAPEKNRENFHLEPTATLVVTQETEEWQRVDMSSLILETEESLIQSKYFSFWQTSTTRQEGKQPEVGTVVALEVQQYQKQR